MKNITIKALAASLLLVLSVSSCQKGNLAANPNAGNANAIVPVSLIVNHLTATLIRNDELPFGDGYKADQFQVSNYAKYWGTNEDTWSYTAHSYEILKYAVQLEVQAQSQVGANSKYLAMAKFFRAYSAIWLSQRVGDIPMSQAGNTQYSTPIFDSQKDVYKNSLKLLEDANTILNTALGTTQSAIFDTGDIFGLTNLQWQKLINTYRLRTLINLSKRANDTPDLNVKAQFAAIINNVATNPIMTGNSDNMVYKFVASNQYPPFQQGNNAYNEFMNVGKTVLDITTATKDPRTFLMATPVNTAANIGSFTNYIGADPGTALATLQNTPGNYSRFNGARYFGNNLGTTAEPFIFVGYPEMCFGVAEAINKGWISGLTANDAKSWYDKGVAASFANFGLNVAANSTVTISDLGGKALGTVTTDNATFLANIAYNTTDATAANAQIQQQKYVAFFMNSGWESFMNHRRTGLPTFSEGGVGIGTIGGKIPKRWLYPLDEINANNANYKASIATQYGGADVVTADTWLTK